MPQGSVGRARWKLTSVFWTKMVMLPQAVPPGYRGSVALFLGSHSPCPLNGGGQTGHMF